MVAKPLPTPAAFSNSGPAQQVRAMGLKVGDVIRGKTHPHSKTEAELTVLWIGIWMVVFQVRRRNNEGKWSEPIESSSWDLTCRDWYLIVDDESADLLEAA